MDIRDYFRRQTALIAERDDIKADRDDLLHAVGYSEGEARRLRREIRFLNQDKERAFEALDSHEKFIKFLNEEIPDFDQYTLKFYEKTQEEAENDELQSSN